MTGAFSELPSKFYFCYSYEKSNFLKSAQHLPETTNPNEWIDIKYAVSIQMNVN